MNRSKKYFKRKYQKIKEKWGMENSWQVVAVLMTFSLAGFSVVYFRGFLFQVLGFERNTSIWIRAIAYLFFVFPAYQLLLLLYGWLLGQFPFFWKKEKMLFKRIKELF